MKSLIWSSLVLVSIGAMASQNAPEDSQQLSKPYSILAYPDFAELKPLPQVRVPVTTTQVTQVVNTTSASSPIDVVPDTNTVSEKPFDLENLDLSGLDPEIARKVASAINKTEPSLIPSNSDHIALEDNQARYRGRLPALNLQTHMYSSDAQRRWVKINGQELKEGDRLNNIQLLAIEPQFITIRFDNDIIDIPALYEWGG
ncbi:general secretion pathway protein GspB [Vibrio mediterranei]|uniref:General secretion pathway protein GspB n=1 Tax=Vibrio mediterranei TaxID=689 RepID=A0A3G4VC34_9VIBR|nr:general secretion pathway protein GspB [Vibrio mediterranei]AYV21839.1 general secretion pathway protein GspB [Vibrio mediterranei]